jgi:hypothetical protein
MVSNPLDLARSPDFLHRIVRSWHTWQGAYLYSLGRHPGSDHQEPKDRETSEQIFWGGHPPEMTNANELRFLSDGEISYYLTWEDSCYFIDKEERGSRARYWMFREYDDVEKYLLFRISRFIFPERYIDSPAMYRLEGELDPWVTLKKPDPVNYPGRTSLRVNDEPRDRGWMGEIDATAVSHILFLSFEELDSLLREGLPADWFAQDIGDD